MAAPSGVDRLFVMLRAAMRGKMYIERKRPVGKQQIRVAKVAKRLEEILYRKFPNRNDYYNMTKGPFEPHLRFAIKTLLAQNQRNLQNLQMTRDAASASGTMISVVNHDALSQQSASLLADRSDTQNNDADEHGRTGTGFQQHQPMADMAALSGVDQQFVMLRTAMREKILEYIGRKQSSPQWRKRMPELAKRLEDILYRKFPNWNGYYNMMKGPVEPHLQFAIKTLSAKNQQHQQNPQMARDAASSSSTMISDVNHVDVCEPSASLPADVQNNNADRLDRTE